MSAGAIAMAFSLLWLPTTAIDGEVIPAGHDSFYHAARIGDLVNQGRLPQFDTKIHAPEGSWVPWPWGYDFALGWLAKTGMAISGADTPMRVLVWLPPIWVLVNVALLLAIAASLRLSLFFRALAAACYAFSPLTQLLHGAGRIDHHFAEQTAVFLILLLGLRWFNQPASLRRAALFGTGIALVGLVHNALFLLQVPVVLAFFVMWVRRSLPERRAMLTFSTALVCGQLAALLPSLPFQNGMYTYQLMSWFHLNVAVGTVLSSIWVSQFHPNFRSILGLGVAGAVMAFPLFKEVLDGLSFMTAEMPELHLMGEARSLFSTGAGAIGLLESASVYTALIFLLPMIALWSIFEVFRTRNPASAYFHLFCICGALILLQQLRFHQLGSFSIYLPWLVLLNELFGHKPRRFWLGITVAVFIAAYIPVKNALLRVPEPGFTADYLYVRGVFRPLAQACDKEPGIVLSDPAEGHPIRYHTQCSVVANNLIITPISRAKVSQAERLFRLSAAELVRQAPWLRYVVVRREDNFLDTTLSAAERLRLNRGLREELLLHNDSPRGFQLVGESVVVTPWGREVVVARAYRIDR